MEAVSTTDRPMTPAHNKQTIRVFVNRCTNPVHWYRDYVGCPVPYISEDEYVYRVLEPHSRYVNFIPKSDAELCTFDEETFTCQPMGTVHTGAL